METKSWKGGTIRLEWSSDADGYFIDHAHSCPDLQETPREPRLGDDVEPAPMVYRKGGKLRGYDIAIGDNHVFLDLLNMPETESGALAFAAKWGGLSAPGSCFLGEFFVLRRRLEMAWHYKSNYRKLMDLLSDKTITRLDARIASKGRGSPPELLLYARNLGEFCWFEVLADVGGVSEVVKCARCGLFFAQSNTRGRTPKYCQGACRQAGYRARKQAQRTR